MPIRLCEQCGDALRAESLDGYCPRCVVRVSLSSMGLGEVLGEADAMRGDFAPIRDVRSRGFEAKQAVRRLGGYEILEEIGRGGMGVVFRARQIDLDRIVAVKTLTWQGSGGEGSAERFRSEARLVASLHHPNIVRVYDIGMEDGCPYFSMEYVEGASLSERLRERPMEPRRAAECLADIAAAIHYAHGHGIIHRDLKPGNVLVDLEGVAKVTDFGVAKRFGVEDGGGGGAWTTELTRPGSLIGTPSYMAPEQLRSGRESAGRTSDVYAMGAVLYHALTGRPPFLAADVESTLLQVIDMEPTPVRELNPAVPDELDAICLKCLEKEPGRRYATAGELEADLRRFVRHEPVVARKTSTIGRVFRWCLRHPVTAGLAAVLVVTLVGVSLAGGVVGVQMHRLRGQEQEARLRAETGEWVALRNAYAADIRLAQHALDAGNSPRAVSLLERYVSGRRGADRTGVAKPRHQLAEDLKRDSVNALLRRWEWHYLWNRCASDEISTVGRHPAAVDEILVLPDGHRAISADRDGVVVVWDLDEGRELAWLRMGGAVLALAASPDGQWIAAGGRDAEGGVVQVWRCDGWVPAGPMRRHERAVTTMRFDPGGGSIQVCDLESVSVWSLPEMNLLKRLPADVGWQAAYSQDGEYLANGISRGRLQVLETGGWTEVNRTTNFFLSRSQPVPVWVRNGQQIASVSGEPYVAFWNPFESMDARSNLPMSSGAIATAASVDGRWLAVATSDFAIRLVDTETLRVEATLEGHRSRVGALAFSTDHRRLVSGDREGVIKLWDPFATRKPVDRVPAGPRGGRYSATSLLDAFAEGGSNNLGRLQLARGWLASEVRDSWPSRIRGCLSQDGRWTARPDDDGIGIWVERWREDGSREEAKKIVAEEVADRRRIGAHMHLSPNGSHLLVMRVDGAIERWDVHTQRRVWRAQREGLGKPTWAIGRDRGQALLIFGCGDGSMEIWDIEKGQRRFALGVDSQFCSGVVLSPDGTLAAGVGMEGVVRIWQLGGEAVEPRRVAEIHAGSSTIVSLAFSPDNLRLAAGDQSGGIQVWDIEDSRELVSLSTRDDEKAAVLSEHAILAIRFSVDGRHLYSMSDKEVRLWRGEGE